MREIQSPLVIVDLLIVDSLVIVDRLSRPNVYFSMYSSRNSGFSHYSGQFAADGRIHYYERRLYLYMKLVVSKRVKIQGATKPPIEKFSFCTIRK